GARQDCLVAFGSCSSRYSIYGADRRSRLPLFEQPTAECLRDRNSSALDSPEHLGVRAKTQGDASNYSEHSYSERQAERTAGGLATRVEDLFRTGYRRSAGPSRVE